MLFRFKPLDLQKHVLIRKKLVGLSDLEVNQRLLYVIDGFIVKRHSMAKTADEQQAKKYRYFHAKYFLGTIIKEKLIKKNWRCATATNNIMKINALD